MNAKPPSRLKSFIRNLSMPVEFCVIVFLYMGIPILNQAGGLLRRFSHTPQAPTTFRLHDSGIISQAILELLSLAIILWIGNIRGWSLKTFGLRRPTWKWTAVGIGLFFAVGLTAHFIGMYLKEFLPTPPAQNSKIISELTMPVILFISIVNPVFEESLWGGYFVHALKRYGLWVVILASALLRTFCHAHLGIGAVINIFPMGVIYGLVYWRWRQLWPLVLAHSIQMFLSLMGRIFINPEVPGSQAIYEHNFRLIAIGSLLFCTFMAWRFPESTPCENEPESIELSIEKAEVKKEEVQNEET